MCEETYSTAEQLKITLDRSKSLPCEVLEKLSLRPGTLSSAENRTFSGIKWMAGASAAWRLTATVIWHPGTCFRAGSTAHATEEWANRSLWVEFQNKADTSCLRRFVAAWQANILLKHSAHIFRMFLLIISIKSICGSVLAEKIKFARILFCFYVGYWQSRHFVLFLCWLLTKSRQEQIGLRTLCVLLFLLKFTQVCNAMTRQPIELESYGNPSKTRKVL